MYDVIKRVLHFFLIYPSNLLSGMFVVSEHTGYDPANLNLFQQILCWVARFIFITSYVILIAVWFIEPNPFMGPVIMCLALTFMGCQVIFMHTVRIWYTSLAKEFKGNWS